MPNRPKSRNSSGLFWCPGCQDFLDKSSFHLSRKTFHGIQSRCKKCERTIRIKWQEKPETYLRELVRKASQRRRLFELDLDWAIHQFERQDGLCYYTGIEMTFGHGQGRVWTNASIDRKDSNLGYNDDNCVLCCTGFNLMKTDLTIQQLIEMCTKFLRHTKEAAWQIR